TWDVTDIFAVSGVEALHAGDFEVVNLRPIVSGLSASSGAAGSALTITGQNFSGAAGHVSVFFGSTAATSVNVLGDTAISVIVPSGSGTVDVTVQSGVNEQDNLSGNPNANVNAPIFGYGTSTPTPADRFTYAGFVPPDAATGKCEDGVAKALAKYMRAVVTCHVKSADSGVKGVPLDDELCESNPSTGMGAKEKYDAATAKLSAKGCTGCAIANADSLRTNAESFLNVQNAPLFCAGSTASLGGEYSGFVPPDEATGKCEDGVAKALARYLG